MHTIFWFENLKGRDHSIDLRHRQEDNIRMNLSETGWKGVDWMHLVQDRDQWQTLVNERNEPSVSIKGGVSLD
jgi:hypothetical protein